MRLSASAPGKLVLMGEYAVLEGAPSLVLAIDRRARVMLETNTGKDWEIVSPTLATHATLQVSDHDARWAGATPPALAWVASLIARFGAAARLPALRITLASEPFYLDCAGQRAKLGLGSSAALTVALLGALHEAAGRPSPTLEECIDAHRAIQGGRGSGIDIAASFSGGLLRFQLDGQRACTSRVSLPRSLHWRCAYSGRAASTRAMLACVAAWHSHNEARYTHCINELATISSRGVDAIASGNAATFLTCFDDYTSALARFGDAAGADIASREHRALGAIAAACGCAYKSCGAGNGDVGVTFAVEDVRLQEFSARAVAAGFPVIELEADPRGLEVVASG